MKFTTNIPLPVPGLTVPGFAYHLTAPASIRNALDEFPVQFRLSRPQEKALELLPFATIETTKARNPFSQFLPPGQFILSYSGEEWDGGCRSQSHWKLEFRNRQSAPNDYDSQIAQGALSGGSVPKAKIRHKVGHKVGGHPDWMQCDELGVVTFEYSIAGHDAALVKELESVGLDLGSLCQDSRLHAKAAEMLDAEGISPAIFHSLAKQWRLLIQLDCDDEMGWRWGWGDIGRLFVFMTVDALSAMNFDKAWFHVQFD